MIGDEQMISGLDWTADTRNLVFSSDRSGTNALWLVPAAGGAALEPAKGAEAGADGPAQPGRSRRRRGVLAEEPVYQLFSVELAGSQQLAEQFLYLLFRISQDVSALWGDLVEASRPLSRTFLPAP